MLRLRVPIVVTGAPGSFTDVGAALLEGFGVDVQAGTGAGIVALQRRMARAVHGSDEGFLADAAVPVPVAQGLLAPFVADAAALLLAAPVGPRWGWSDASTTLLLDWWEERLGDAAYLLLYRPPWDASGVVADGSPDGPAPEAVLRTWVACNELLLDFHDRHADRCLLVEGGALISDPGPALVALDALTGGLTGGGSDALARAWTAVAPAVDRRQRHRRADEEPVHKLLDSLPVEVRLLLGELDRRAQVRDDSPRPPVASLVPGRPPRPAAGAVVVTCCDDGPLLLDTLASIRSCRADAVETVVVDHGSTDDETVALLDAVEVAGVSVVRTAGPAVAAARNAGVAATVAPLVTFLEAGALLMPGFVAAAAACFERAEDVAAVGGGLSWFGPGGTGLDPDGGVAPWEAVGPGGAWRRDAVVAANGFDEHQSAPGLEDLDLRLSLLSRGWRVVTLDVPAAQRRAGPSGESASDGMCSTLGRVIEKHQSQATAALPYAELLRAAAAAVAAARVARHRAVTALEEARRAGAQATGTAQDRLADAAARERGAQAALAAAARGGRILEERVDELTDEVARREHDAEAARRRGADEHAARRAEGARADELAHQLAAIHATKLWRWSVRPRQVYALIRRLQDSPPRVRAQ